MRLHVAVSMFVIASVGIALYAVISSNAYKDKLMAECLADGKKEYECYSMLRSTQPVVNNIQVGR